MDSRCNKGKFGLMRQSLISIKGTMEMIIDAIDLCIDHLDDGLEGDILIHWECLWNYKYCKCRIY